MENEDTVQEKEKGEEIEVEGEEETKGEGEQEKEGEGGDEEGEEEENEKEEEEEKVPEDQWFDYCDICKVSIVDMEKHTQTQYHVYNLNRAKMDLKPFTKERFIKRKQEYRKKLKEMNRQKAEEDAWEAKCDVCIRKFTRMRKYSEHCRSKSHHKREKRKKRREKGYAQAKDTKTEEKTTKEDQSICLFCNRKNETIDLNIKHMVDVHSLDVPFLFCIKRNKELIDFLSTKVFDQNACLTCNNTNFVSHHALQNHMIDKVHAKIPNEDLLQYIYKMYDLNKLLALKDFSLRKMEEFKIIVLKHKVAPRTDETNTSNNEEKKPESTSDALGQPEQREEGKESLDPDYEPIELPNGELLLEDGSVIGNKMYKLYYKQRIHYSKYDNLQRRVKNEFDTKRSQMRRGNHHQPREWTQLQGSNKSNFHRINNIVKVVSHQDKH